MVATKKRTKRAVKPSKAIPKKTILRKKQPEIEEIVKVNPAPQLETTIIEDGTDRMLRYKRNPHCPECDAHPVICTIRRISYKAFRCRMCGHRWEVNY